MLTRREAMIAGAAAVVGGVALLEKDANAQATTEPSTRSATPQAEGDGTYTPVVTPNGSTLAWTMEDGFKTFRLTAEPVKREFAKGMVVDCWGYNGQSPGPTIEAVEGDRVRIYVTNKLPEPTTIHWHGMIVPNAMDGVSGVSQPDIMPGETYIYEFELKQHGTQMYHPHADDMLQMAMGMEGFFIIHPRSPREPRVDRDFCIFLQEWFIEPGSSKPNPMVMTDFNLFTFNSRVYPGTDPLIIRLGQRVRIRLANLSMDSHPIHFHGHHGYVTGTDGGPIPQAAWLPEVTVNVPVGTTRDLEFVADNPGDWPLHCHKNHHAMNAMSHDVPNVIGVDMSGVNKGIENLLPDYMTMGGDGMFDMAEMHMPLPKNTLPMMAGKGPFGAIGMGGMFTLIKIRDGIQNYNDPGWYEQPAGTAARKVKNT
jgi:FtsP/CotA-like multicopper oxidase with cupredoxin domain